MNDKWWVTLIVGVLISAVGVLFDVYNQLVLDNAQNIEDKRYNLQVDINTKDIAVLKERCK